MAEALGVAASVAGVASFALQLAQSVSTIKCFCGDVKNAPQRLETLVEEIEIMAELLALFSAEKESLMEGCGSPLYRCHSLCTTAVQSLAAVANDLTLSMQRRRYRTSAKMVLKRDELAELVDRVERSRNLLNFAHQLYVATQGQKQIASYYTQLQDLQSGQASLFTLLQNGDASNAQPEQSPGEEALHYPTRNQKRQQHLGKGQRDDWTITWTTSSRLLASAWSISIHRATMGWSCSLHYGAILPCSHPVWKSIDQGDLNGLRRQLDAREVSLYDRNKYGYSLVKDAARSGQMEIVRFLHSQGVDFQHTWSDSNTILCAYWRSIPNVLDVPSFDDIVRSLRFFAEEGDVDLEQSNRYLDAPLHLTSGTLATWTVQQRLMIFRDGLSDLNVPEAFACVLKPALTDASYFQVSLNVWYRPFLLHLLAEAVGRHTNQADSGTQQDPQLTALIAAAVTAGSDLHVLSGLGTGMTPLMHVLYGAMTHCYSEHEHKVLANKMQANLRDWVTTLYEAGVPLTRYGKREAKLFSKHWRTSQGVLWRFCSQHINVYQIAYGAKPSDWHLWEAHPGDCFAGIFWDMLEHPKRALPGAWVEEESLSLEPSQERPSWALNKNNDPEDSDSRHFPE